MADNKQRLARDPNIPFDEQKQLASLPYYRGATHDRRSVGKLRAPAEPEAEAPAPAPVDPLSPSQRSTATEYGTDVGQKAQGFLAERKRLAPGVRRWGSNTADPSDVYMTVDRNGNRVYTDDAQFAAGQSRGRLTRRDLAPGMAESDAQRTLNDPEGGFEYAPASPEFLQGIQKASNLTRGGSEWVERARSEAERSQAIADTRAGSRDIDKRRKDQSATLRRRMGLVEEGDGLGGLTIRDLLAIKADDRAERQLAHTVDNDAIDNSRENNQNERSTVKDMSELLVKVRSGEADPEEVRDLIATLPTKQAERATNQLRQSLLQRYLTEQDPFFLGPDEIALAQPSSIRRNPDGSGTYVEPDSGAFTDIGRNIDLSPEIMAMIYGGPEDLDATRDDELTTRLRRGF